VDTGSGFVGLEPPHCGGEFHEAWNSADVVISKGMANLETLTEYPEFLAGKAVFFLLCAKCAPVASALGVEKGSEVFIAASGLHK
jgi:uncharacterized protein with ATP-grasp and redox domains